jgi:hypothetical protein
MTYPIIKEQRTEEQIIDRLYPLFGEINAIHVMEFKNLVIIRFEDEDGTFTRVDWNLRNDSLEKVYLDGSRQLIN